MFDTQENASIRGAALLYVIAGLVVLGAVGAGMARLSSYSTMGHLMEINNKQAQYLAFSGYEYWKGNGPNFDGATLTLSDGDSISYTEIDNGDGTYDLTIVGCASPGASNEASFQLARYDEPDPSDTEGGPRPPTNNSIIEESFDDSTASLVDPSGVVDISAYVADSGYHDTWAAFLFSYQSYTDVYERVDGKWCAWYVATISSQYSDALKEVYDTYGNVDYDVQVKMGWYKDFDSAVSGIAFRWHEDEGYMLSFMRYTDYDSGNNQGHGHGQQQNKNDYIVNAIKPGEALEDDVLVVLWEKRGNSWNWLAYSVLGPPSDYRPGGGPGWGHGHNNDDDEQQDPKVLGEQSSVDGKINDNAGLVVRVEDYLHNGEHTNRIKVFYSDASSHYDPRSTDGVATNIDRKRYPPEWVDADLFPSWPSNDFETRSEESDIIAYWNKESKNYDYFTLESASPTGPDNTVTWTLNPSADGVALLDDHCTIETENFTLADFQGNRREVGLHVMGKLNSYDQTVAFDDLAIQILGEEEE